MKTIFPKLLIGLFLSAGLYAQAPAQGGGTTQPGGGSSGPSSVVAGSGLSGGGSTGAVTLNGTITCAGSPGNTTLTYRQTCSVTGTGALYVCNNSAGCTVAADVVAVGTAGAVTVVGAGSLTSMNCVTGGGSQTIQTPSASCTVDSSGNLHATTASTTGTGSGSYTMSGASSGSAAIGVAAAAGTPSVFDIPTADPGGANYLLQSAAPSGGSMQTSWTNLVGSAIGGTGVDNGSKTLTLGGNTTFSGAFNPTFAIPSSSTWTFPTGPSTLIGSSDSATVSNTMLAHPSATVNGQTCTLGSTCTTSGNLISHITPLTAQAANTSLTSFLTTAASNGYYQVCAEITETQQPTVSGTLPGIEYAYTSAISSATIITVAIFSSGADVGFNGANVGCAVLFAKASTAISYQTFGYATSGATPLQYALSLSTISANAAGN